MSEAIFYSADNATKFDVSSLIFGDTVLEVLHHTEKENKFKQLFLVQFHTFFLTENGIRFTKDQIDGISKDIRYPDEFFIDFIFDDTKSTQISVYDEEVSKWKNIISDFIMKGYKNVYICVDAKNENDSSNSSYINSNSNSKTNFTQKEDNLIKNKLETNISTIDSDKLYENEKHDTDKDDDITSKPNTHNKAKEILQRFSISKENYGNKQDEEEDDEDQDEEDLENYFKNLENKTK